MTSPRTNQDDGRVIPLSPADAGRMSQGERIGRIENQFSRLLGMATVIGVVFTIFSATIFTIFYNANTSVIGLGKDIEVLKTYIREDRNTIDVLSKAREGAETKILKLEGRIEYQEKVLRDLEAQTKNRNP